MDLFNRNSIWIGILCGLAFPVMVFGIVMMLFEFGADLDIFDEVTDPLSGKRLQTTTLITLCANIILIRIFNKRFTQDTLRGVLLVTFLGAVVWFISFYEEIMASF